MLSRKEIKTLKYWTWTGPSCSPPRSTSTYPSLWHLANEREREILSYPLSTKMGCP